MVATCCLGALSAAATVGGAAINTPNAAAMAIDRRFIGSLLEGSTSEIHSFGATSRDALQVDSAREYARVTSHVGAHRCDVRRFVSEDEQANARIACTHSLIRNRRTVPCWHSATATVCGPPPRRPWSRRAVLHACSHRPCVDPRAHSSTSTSTESAAT